MRAVEKTHAHSTISPSAIKRRIGALLLLVQMTETIKQARWKLLLPFSWRQSQQKFSIIMWLRSTDVKEISIFVARTFSKRFGLVYH